MSERSDLIWPFYFAKRPLTAKRLQLKAGEQFPMQEKSYIRGLGPAYGVKDADRVPFVNLDYVEVINVRSEEMARHIRDMALSAGATKKLLGAPHGH